MTLAYTVCSLNYLPYARSFYESFRRFHPHVPFVVGLVDRINGRILAGSLPFEILEVETLQEPAFGAMCQRYSMHELSCALKPFFGEYLLRRHPEASELWYFDTDMLVFGDLSLISERLRSANILLTPHFWTPFKDGKHQREVNFLNAGLYNAGFFALRRSTESLRFLAWWKDRLQQEGYLRYDLGMGSDQLWLNFVPLYFEGVHLEQDLGFNAAYWNLHERQLSQKDGQIWVNDAFLLRFFHFSGFSPQQPQTLSKHQNRWTFENRPDVVPLFEQYRQALDSFADASVSSAISAFDKRYFPQTLPQRVGHLIKKVAAYFLWKWIKIVQPDPIV
jgi:hypothetical protein